ncbi:Glycosyltransferase involved in cell wall bisynthesis [Halanaerobium congolense]|uniref:Glycosyltransferase involved in cell wall bisynthesis n=1 Tax=Halanaerobium congolense TaxID=54121 RepID=A0A1G8QXQ9_9FIRM|nr:glycosyltransferase [Halanaerobium congolense]SDJ09461.1 Glycosyltransferase involved in cell wall bisynthesis [Halanaerobium congolense]SET70824.1 Glycosyltransferase involved in cell wall bisynthesis [Halanaerobium congolense]
MKVLHIINSLNIGGAQNLLLDSIDYYKKKNIKITVLSLSTNFKPLTNQKSDVIKVIDSDNPKSFKSFFCLFKYLNNHEFDIIHAHLFPTIYYCSIFKKIGLFENPLVITEHSTYNKRRKHKINKPIEKFIYNEFDKVVCISDGTEKQLNKWLKIGHKTEIIYNGVSLNKFVSKKSIVNIEDKNIIKIIMVANFLPQKDQLTVVKAMKRLDKRYELYFVGDGSEISHIKKQVEKLNLDERVFFLGKRNDVPNLLRKMDLFVLSSKWEGFGLVVIEAMASGLPVIASDVIGLSEIVNGYGALFELGDFESLSKKIFKLTQDNQIYSEYVSKSILRANHFSLEKMVNNYIDLYQNLIE